MVDMRQERRRAPGVPPRLPGEGLDGHYPACPRGGRKHRTDADPRICVKYPWIRERSGSGARRVIMAQRRARHGVVRRD